MFDNLLIHNWGFTTLASNNPLFVVLNDFDVHNVTGDCQSNPPPCVLYAHQSPQVAHCKVHLSSEQNFALLTSDYQCSLTH